MADATQAARKGCFKRGFIGCFSVLGVCLVLVTVWALITVARGKQEVVRESDLLTHDIPQGNWIVPDTSEPPIVDAGQMGRVILDISLANFTIIPTSPGTPVRLDAHYNSGSYKLKETFASSGELGWTYRLTFGKRSMFQFFHIDPDNRLELYLPEGTPIVLEGQLGVGKSQLELGGLWIESVDLEIGIGDHSIDFDKPLAVPMTRFEIDGSIGELRIRLLGNASPAHVRIDHSIGALYVDLRGAWQNDSDVFVDSSIGKCHVDLPAEGIGLELVGASITFGESDTRGARRRGEVPVGAPVVRLRVSHSLGELRLTD